MDPVVMIFIVIFFLVFIGAGCLVVYVRCYRKVEQGTALIVIGGEEPPVHFSGKFVQPFIRRTEIMGAAALLGARRIHGRADRVGRGSLSDRATHVTLVASNRIRFQGAHATRRPAPPPRRCPSAARNSIVSEIKLKRGAISATSFRPRCR